MRIKDEQGHWYEEISNYTYDREKINEIRKTDISNETFNLIFEERGWWSPIEDIKKRPGYCRSSKKEDIFICSGRVRYILFDTIDGENQIIRVIDYINKENKSLKEGWRYILNPNTRELISVRFPDKRHNPLSANNPWKGYSTGGWEYLHIGCLANNYFKFHKLVPGITPEKIIKKLFQEIFLYGEEIEDNKHLYSANNYVWLSDASWTSILLGRGLFEIFWKDLNLKNLLYSGSINDEVNLKEFEKYRKSFLLAKKWGVDFKDHINRQLWLDLVKMLDREGYDIKSPRWIAGDIRKLHDEIVKKSQIKEERRREKETLQRLKYEEELYQKEKGNVIHKILIDGLWKVEPVQSVKDCYEIGKELHNCCYHAGYYKRKNLLIKIIYDNKLLELAEITSTREICQCLGLCNKESEKHEEVLEKLKKYLNEIK